VKIESWYSVVSTCFGLGCLTSMPGTLASFVAFLIYIIYPVNLWIIAGVFLLGVFAADRYIKERGNLDPGEVVIDEVVGSWIAFFGFSPGAAFAALFLFRVFDILKPFPVNAAEKLPGGVGVMADDVVAGLYANLLVRGIFWIFLPALSG